jgi:6-phosphogluconolactonase (cycloisomerase 2 family)
MSDAAGATDLYIATVSNGVVVHDLTQDGDVAPLRHLAGAQTTLQTVYAVAVDQRHGELFLADWTSNRIVAFDLDADGDVVPLRTISGATTLLDHPLGIAYDPDRDEIVVTDYSSPDILVFDRSASGDVAPTRHLIADIAGSIDFRGVTVDVANGRILCANLAANSVDVFPRTATGLTAPSSRIVGASTLLDGPYGLYLDLVHNELIVSTILGPTSAGAVVFGRNDQGNVAPLRHVEIGSVTSVGVAVAHDTDELIISNQGGSIDVFPRTADGAFSSGVRRIFGGSTELGSSSMIWVTEGLVYADGFESGDPTAWSSSVP